MAHTPCVIGN